MRALVQRVSTAKVTCSGEVISEIGHGLLILLGVSKTDTSADADFLAGKISRLRIFGDEHGKMNLSLIDVAGEALVVSQFTLYGDTRRGNRPGFDKAALPEQAESLYHRFMDTLAGLLVPVKAGVFGGDMKVSLENDGPVTLMLESDQATLSKS